MFLVFRALKTRRHNKSIPARNIFMVLVTLMILPSYNYREFANNVVSSLKECLPTLKIVHGKPHHKAKWSVERANQDIENSL